MVVSGTETRPTSVLFVCLGNICRSPMAEGVFRSLTDTLPSSSRAPLSSDRFIIDSAGTGAYHELSPPDSRTLAVLKKHGITNYDHSARKVRIEDFGDFDYIFAMDSENLEDLNEARDKFLRSKKGTSNDQSRVAKVALFGSVGGKNSKEEVDDPYYGGNDGFDRAFEQVTRFSKGFLQFLETSTVPAASSSQS